MQAAEFARIETGTVKREKFAPLPKRQCLGYFGDLLYLSHVFLVGLPRFWQQNRVFRVFHKDTKTPTISQANSWGNVFNERKCLLNLYRSNNLIIAWFYRLKEYSIKYFPLSRESVSVRFATASWFIWVLIADWGETSFATEPTGTSTSMVIFSL